MMRMVPLLPVLLCFCAASPATRNPLRDQMASIDSGQLEDAIRACLEKTGWKVDPVPGLMGGARKVGASRRSGATDIYIYPPDMSPRITGGPDYDSPFWSCLGSELGGAKPAESAAPPAE